MIGRLRGVFVSRKQESILIEVVGVGYEVHVTPRDLAALPRVGEEIVVHTHTHVREDEMSLFGFVRESDRDLFRILLGASGVGPRMAMALLAALTGEEIVRAVTGEDPEALTVAPGVGKRGAQKIVLELGPKLNGRETEVVASQSLGGVRQALEGLGYSTAEINAVVADIEPDQPIEAQVKTALQRLARR